MESIGEKIRKIREDKGYSLDQVARDTHITRRFLEAIEQENFSVLPGESYVVGFLRSYSEYLGLDADEVVTLYRNMKIQEQPAPLNELLEKPRISPAAIVALVAVIAVVATAAVLLAISSGDQGASAMSTNAEASAKPAASTDIIERSFAAGETVRLASLGIDLEAGITIKDGQAALVIGGAPISLPLQKEVLLDLNQDGVMDIRVFVREIETRNSPNSVVIRFDRAAVAAPSAAASPAATEPGAVPAAVGALPVPPIAAGTTNQGSRLRQAQAITDYAETELINLGIRFDAPTVFRYETDAGKRDERVSLAGETINLSSPGWIRVWTVNGGATMLKVGGREIKAGADGEVTGWTLQWTAGATGRQLQLAPLY